MDLSARIADLAGQAVTPTGLIVDGVAVHSAGKNTRVLVTVDLPGDAVGSADLDAVAAASRAIGKVLDDENVPSGPYLLEVSTPGVDRPLTERRHFARARTRLVAFDLTGGDTVIGRIVDVTDAEVVIETDRGSQSISLADVTRGRVQIEMKRIDADD